jgi:hypothetical protein
MEGFFSGYAAPLCGKALPFRRGAKALIPLIVLVVVRKGEAFPHSRAAEPHRQPAAYFRYF